MRMQNRAARRYLREVRSWLPCSGKSKKKILGEISGRVREYLSQYPEAGYGEIEAQFGTPQRIAASYVDEMETPELLRQLRIRGKVVKIIGAVALAVMLLWAGTVSLALADSYNSAHGYIERTIIEKSQGGLL